MVAGRRTGREATRARIVAAFLRLATERGIDATTTRAIAEEAGVNELTLFRHFGDKATLAREAVRAAAPTELLRAHRPVIDVSTPEATVAGLAACLRFLRDQMLDRQDLLQFALAEARRHPELREELLAGPRQAGALLADALRQAGPRLRAEVDPQAAMLSLEGLLLLTVLWTTHGWMTLDRPAWDSLLESAVRVLVDVSP
jgi:AcrR family transcriptional regulator